jgi:hypothetical protein
MTENIPRFMTIRETARTGILSEYRLRCMDKAGQLPAIRAGNKTLINFDRLCEQLNQLGSQNGGEAIER